MKNHLVETVNAIAATFKKCCPSHIDAPEHITEWHDENESILTFSEEDAREDYLQRTGQR